jgi:hypothetical protein
MSGEMIDHELRRRREAVGKVSVHGPAEDRRRATLHRRLKLLRPFGDRLAVVVREAEQRRARFRGPAVPGYSRPSALLDHDLRACDGRGSLEVDVASVLDDDDLELRCDRLRTERSQAPLERLRPRTRGHHDAGPRRCHCSERSCDRSRAR